MSKVSCLLRTHRLKWGFYQKELAALIPRSGADRVSRVERNLRPPIAREILAYRVIFGFLPDELLLGLATEVEDAVVRNAYLMHQELEGVTSARAVKKRALLEALLARAADRARQNAQ